MRALSILLAGFLAVVVIVVGQHGIAEASFHCVRIHAVMGGLAGDQNVQYVELRMNAGGQNLVAGKSIQFRDSAGTLKATFTFPTNVANALTGESILVATAEFNALAGGGTADYAFSAANTVGSNGGDPLHPIQGPGGKVAWAQGFDNCDADLIAGPGEVDSLAYGGAPADFGSAAAALPVPGTNQALRINNLNLAPANNSTEYSLASIATTSFSVAPANLATDLTTPRNNGRVVIKVATPSSVGGIALEPDAGMVRATGPTAGDEREQRLMIAVAALAGIAAAAAAGVWYWRTRHSPGD